MCLEEFDKASGIGWTSWNEAILTRLNRAEKSEERSAVPVGTDPLNFIWYGGIVERHTDLGLGMDRLNLPDGVVG